MFEISIDGIKKLDRFAKTSFAERAIAFEKVVMRELVERVKDAIVSEIPTHLDEPWLKLYRESFEVYEIEGLPEKITTSQKPEGGFVISSRVSGDWSMVDGEKMVVDFKMLDGDEHCSVGKVLAEYSPFAVDHIPSLADYGARVIAKRVRQEEVKEVRARNDAQAASLTQALREADAEFVNGPPKIAGKIYFDMVFAVLSMELSKGEIRKPHWRPALRKIGVFLHQIMMSHSFTARIRKIFDPKNVNWEHELDPRPAPPEIRVSDLSVLEDFQTRIWQPRAR
jgi:hypothetical protein